MKQNIVSIVPENTKFFAIQHAPLQAAYRAFVIGRKTGLVRKLKATFETEADAILAVDRYYNRSLANSPSIGRLWSLPREAHWATTVSGIMEANG